MGTEETCCQETDAIVLSFEETKWALSRFDGNLLQRWQVSKLEVGPFMAPGSRDGSKTAV